MKSSSREQLVILTKVRLFWSLLLQILLNKKQYETTEKHKFFYESIECILTSRRKTVLQHSREGSAGLHYSRRRVGTVHWYY